MNDNQPSLLLKDLVAADALSRPGRFTAKQVGRVCGAGPRAVAAYLDDMVKAGRLDRTNHRTQPIYTVRAQ